MPHFQKYPKCEQCFQKKHLVTFLPQSLVCLGSCKGWFFFSNPHHEMECLQRFVMIQPMPVAEEGSFYMVHNPPYPMKYLCSPPKGTSFRVAMVTDRCFCLTLGRNRLQLEKIWKNNLVNWHDTLETFRETSGMFKNPFQKSIFQLMLACSKNDGLGRSQWQPWFPHPFPWYCCPNTKDVQRLLPLQSFPTWSNDSVASNDIRCDQHLNMFFGSPWPPLSIGWFTRAPPLVVT